MPEDIMPVPESMKGLAEALGRTPTPEEAFWLFLTPPRIQMARRELEVMADAVSFEISQGGDVVKAYEFGAGQRVVVLVHGWGGRGAQLAAFVEPLLNLGFKVIVFDGPGHGDSEGDRCYAPRMAACIRLIAEREGGLHGVLGHSFGTIGINLVLDAGLSLRRVVELAPFCWIERRFIEFARAVGLDAAGEAEMMGITDRYFKPGFLQAKAADLIAGRFTARGLLIHDEDDREIGIAHAEAIAKVWPDVEFVRTTGLGHRRIIRDKGVIQCSAEFLAQP